MSLSCTQLFSCTWGGKRIANLHILRSYLENKTNKNTFSPSLSLINNSCGPAICHARAWHLSFKKVFSGVGEMAQHLRTLNSLPEELAGFNFQYLEGLTNKCLLTPVSKIPTASHRQTYMQVKHQSTLKKIKNKKCIF